MKCPDCRMDIAEGSLNCPFCKRVLERPEPDQPALPRASLPADDAPPSWKEVLGLPENLSVKMLKPLVAGLILTLLWVAIARATIDTVPDFDLVPLRPEQDAVYPFEGHKQYVIAYLTPESRWSEWSLPTVTAMNYHLGKSDEVLFVVIVGRGDEEAVRAMAEEIEAPVYLDAEGVAAEALDVTEIPHWMVVNKRGEITKRLSETWRPVDAHLRMLRID